MTPKTQSLYNNMANHGRSPEQGVSIRDKHLKALLKLNTYINTLA